MSHGGAIRRVPREDNNNDGAAQRHVGEQRLRNNVVHSVLARVGQWLVHVSYLKPADQHINDNKSRAHARMPFQAAALT